jgi:hypothetical protein
LERYVAGSRSGLMCEDDPAFSIGELNAKMDMILEEQRRMRMDLDELKGYKSKLVGMGASASFVFMAVGFLFGDTIRSMAKRIMGG